MDERDIPKGAVCYDTILTKSTGYTIQLTWKKNPRGRPNPLVHGFTGKQTLIFKDDFPMNVKVTLTGQEDTRRSIIVTHPDPELLEFKKAIAGMDEADVRYLNNTLFRRGFSRVDYTVPDDGEDNWRDFLTSEARRLGAAPQQHSKRVSLVFPGPSKPLDLVGELRDVAEDMTVEVRRRLTETFPTHEDAFDKALKLIKGKEEVADQLYLTLKRSSTLLAQHAPYLIGAGIDHSSDLHGFMLIAEYLQEITNILAGCMSELRDLNEYVKDTLAGLWQPHNLDWMLAYHDKCSAVFMIVNRQLGKLVRGEKLSNFEIMSILKHRKKGTSLHRTFEYIDDLVNMRDREEVFNRIEQYASEYWEKGPRIGVQLRGIEAKEWDIVGCSRKICFELRNLVRETEETLQASPPLK